MLPLPVAMAIGFLPYSNIIIRKTTCKFNKSYLEIELCAVLVLSWEKPGEKSDMDWARKRVKIWWYSFKIFIKD